MDGGIFEMWWFGNGAAFSGLGEFMVMEELS